MSFNSGKLGCKADFTATLAAGGNAAAKSHDKHLVVLTDTAGLVHKFLLKCPLLDTRKGQGSEEGCSTALLCFPYLPSAAPAVGYPCSAMLWELPEGWVFPLSGNCPVVTSVLPSEVAGTDWSIDTCKEQVQQHCDVILAVSHSHLLPAPQHSASFQVSSQQAILQGKHGQGG